MVKKLLTLFLAAFVFAAVLPSVHSWAATEYGHFDNSKGYYIWLKQDSFTYRWNVSGKHHNDLHLDDISGDNCLMKITNISGDYYSIRWDKSGEYFDTDTQKYETGKTVHEWHDSIKQDNQYFRFVLVSRNPDTYMVESKITDSKGNHLYLGLDGNKSAESGRKIVTCDKKDACQWIVKDSSQPRKTFQSLGYGSFDTSKTYHIWFKEDNLRYRWNVDDSGLYHNSVHLHDTTGKNCTMQFAATGEDGYYAIRYTGSNDNQYFDTDTQKYEPGKTIHQWHNDIRQDNQKFRFVCISHNPDTYVVESKITDSDGYPLYLGLKGNKKPENKLDIVTADSDFAVEFVVTEVNEDRMKYDSTEYFQPDEKEEYYIWLNQASNQYRWNVDDSGLHHNAVHLDDVNGHNCVMQFTKADNDGFYGVRYKYSDEYFDTDTESYKAGCTIHQWHDTMKQDNQKFRFVCVSHNPDTYVIESKIVDDLGNPMYLGLKGNQPASKGLDIVTVDGKYASQWQIEKRPKLEEGVKISGSKDKVSSPADGAPTFMVYPKGFVRGLSVEDDALHKNDKIHLFHLGTTSKVALEWIDSQKAYRIRNFLNTETHTNNFSRDMDFVWDVDDMSMAEGASIHVIRCQGDGSRKDSQLWRLVEADKDAETYYIQNVNSHLYAKLASNQDADEVRLVQGSFDSATAFEFHMVYNTESFHTSSQDPVNAGNWMSKIDDSIPLSYVNVPGTHDAGACAFAEDLIDPVSSDTGLAVYCQNQFLDEQLNSGIRAWDIRISKIASDVDFARLLDSGGPEIIHGFDISFYSACYRRDRQKLQLKNVFDTAASFLSEHKGETVIITLKGDGTIVNTIGIGTDDYVGKCVLDMIEKYNYPVYTPDDISQVPSMKDVRGKIVLVSRLDLSNSMKEKYTDKQLRQLGPDASQWDANDYTSKKEPIRVGSSNVYVQDNYSEADPDTKLQYFTGTADYATNHDLTQSNYLFNYSASKDTITISRSIDLKMMASDFTSLKQVDKLENRKCLGFVMGNYVDPLLSRKIYMTNFDSTGNSLLKINRQAPPEKEENNGQGQNGGQEQNGQGQNGQGQNGQEQNGQNKKGNQNKTTVKTPSFSKANNLKGKKIGLKWKKVPGVTGYQIQYSTSKDFKKNAKKIWIRKNTITGKTLSKLKKKTYYIRIRAFKKVSGKYYYSKWSKKKKLKIKK